MPSHPCRRAPDEPPPGQRALPTWLIPHFFSSNRGGLSPGAQRNTYVLSPFVRPRSTSPRFALGSGGRPAVGYTSPSRDVFMPYLEASGASFLSPTFSLPPTVSRLDVASFCLVFSSPMRNPDVPRSRSLLYKHYPRLRGAVGARARKPRRSLGFPGAQLGGLHTDDDKYKFALPLYYLRYGTRKLPANETKPGSPRSRRHP